MSSVDIRIRYGDTSIDIEEECNDIQYTMSGVIKSTRDIHEMIDTAVRRAKQALKDEEK